MACATLKRSLDWENITHRPSKRRRCNPFDDTNTRTSTSAAALKAHNTAAAAAAAALMVSNSATTITTTKRPVVAQKRCNPFAEANVPVMTTEKMSQNICDEIKRLHKRKQLPFSVSGLEHMNDSESSGSEMLPENSSTNTSTTSSAAAAAAAAPLSKAVPASRNSDKPLFTFRQVVIH